MASLQIDILNPKANKLLQTLADLNLIAIKKVDKDRFLKTIRKIRAKAKTNSPSFEEITREVESVRTRRYARSKK